MTKFLDKSKWKGFANDKTNVAKKLKFVLQKVEDKKGENGGYQCFLLFFPQCF